jgi:hypothetical protein
LLEAFQAWVDKMRVDEVHASSLKEAEMMNMKMLTKNLFFSG